MAKRQFSLLSMLLTAATGYRNLERHWRNPSIKPYYDVIIVGAGGHGLATAYYLAKHHNLTNVAVIEKGWLGGGNVARNTAHIRSNYLHDESAAIYDYSLRLWSGLSQELNYNVMFSPRGVLVLAHNIHEVQTAQRHIHANRLTGIDNEWLTPDETKAYCPPLSISDNARYKVLGAALQRRGGNARHDAVAWGYARAADSLGVDIIQHCEVTGFIRGAAGSVEGVLTSRGPIRSSKVGVVAAGNTSSILAHVDLPLPLQSVPLQALVTEPLKPVLPCVVMSSSVHAYISQSDKGELVIGAAADQYVSYSQRGGPQVNAATIRAICELFPQFSRLRMMRSWAGTIDITPDRSPIIDRTELPGLYINCGWGAGGFKATPASGEVFASMLAKGEPHPLGRPFSLERFRTGRLIDEAAAAGVAH